MVRDVLFSFGTPVGAEDLDTESRGDQNALRRFLQDGDLALLDELSKEPRFAAQLVATEVGRGAGATGIALELVRDGGVYIGAAVAFVETGRAVRWAYRRFSRHRGNRPMVSLGAAEYLAAADLADRIGMTDLVLVGSGDVRSNSQDRAFSGGDAFWIVIDDHERWHHYQVTAYGETTYVGMSPRAPEAWDDPGPTALEDD